MIASQISLERLQCILEHYIVLNNGKEYDDSALQKMKSAVDKMEAIKQIITELRLRHKDLERVFLHIDNISSDAQQDILYM